MAITKQVILKLREDQMYDFSYTPEKHDPLTFSINGKQIENVKFFKFLDIMLDEHLT